MSRKQSYMLLVVLVITVTVVVWVIRDDKKTSHLAHTTTIYAKPYKPLDDIKSYFGEIGWGGTTSLQSFVKYRFGENVLGNLTKIRFDSPNSKDYDVDPTVQYYHPKGGGAFGAYSFPEVWRKKELNSNSSIHYTFANKSNISDKRKEEIIKKWKRRGVSSEEAILMGFASKVTAVVTYVRKEMCEGAEEHAVSLLPWPQRPSPEDVVKFKTMRACYKHPEGWYYYIFPAYFPGYLDVLAYQKHSLVNSP